MQDSIEDYIKISNNIGQEEPTKINKEVQITAQRKKECDMRAMKIVEFSIEGKLGPEIFTRCLPFINQSHYQDIVEERAITKLCGYSLCGKRIPDMPKKQYYISTRSNKVYDITDRKNYCSNFCYKASLHIKNQIDNSPLWLRKLEDIPEYQLMDSSGGGLPGEYMDQGTVKPAVEPRFTSVSMFTSVSLTDMADNEKNKEKPCKGKGASHRRSSKLLKSTMQTITENSEQIEEEEELIEKPSSVNKNTKTNKRLEHSNSLNTLPVIDENEEKFETKSDIDENVRKNSEASKANSNKKSKRKSSKSQKIDIELLICNSLKEWLTIETFIFIHGESKVKEILNEKKLSDYFDQLNIKELQRDQQIKYMNVCKRLQMQEMADEKFDNALIGNTKLKPVPDYKKLRDGNKDLNLKVKSFYSGVLHEKEDTNFPTQGKKKNEVVNDEDGPPAVLPLVDANSQNAMRRKIFLTSVNKSMQQLLQALKVSQFSTVLSDLQTLVRTFNLKADNIVFKPTIWNYISITLLNILSIHDNNIKNILEEKQNQRYIELQLSSLPNKVKLMSHVLTLVQNVDLFVETYISSK